MSEPDALLDLVPDALLTVSVCGTVRYANAAARALLGADAIGSQLADALAPEARPRFADYLRRSSGSGSSTIGAFDVTDAAGTSRRFTFRARQLSGMGPGPVVLGLRVHESGLSRFSVLAQTVRRLNQQVRLRQAAQHELESALHERDLLLRELQHRVKNQLQMLMSMFSAAGRRGAGPELAAFLSAVRGRLVAMSVVHDAMHHSRTLDSASAGVLLRALVVAVANAHCPEAEVELDVEDHEIYSEKALPIALMVNELITNACKYGLVNGCGQIRVRFRRVGNEYELTIHNSGPGLPEPAAPGGRRSGLGLVEALAGQLFGTLSMENDAGAKCTVRFPVRRELAA